MWHLDFLHFICGHFNLSLDMLCCIYGRLIFVCGHFMLHNHDCFLLLFCC